VDHVNRLEVPYSNNLERRRAFSSYLLETKRGEMGSGREQANRQAVSVGTLCLAGRPPLSTNVDIDLFDGGELLESRL
jgi:hypothetical protein